MELNEKVRGLIIEMINYLIYVSFTILFAFIFVFAVVSCWI